MIKISKIFENIVKERLTIDGFPPNLVLIPKFDERDSQVLLLYDIKNKEPIGYISYWYDNQNDVFSVSGAYSKSGFGPFLYEAAMTNIYPKGLSLSRDSETSEDALNVWEKFWERSDVKKERMNSDEITHKKEDLPNSGYDEKQIERILELEDTRFIYSFGEGNLNKLLDIGLKYMKKMGWRYDVEYEDIVISLEP